MNTIKITEICDEFSSYVAESKYSVTFKNSYYRRINEFKIFCLKNQLYEYNTHVRDLYLNTLPDNLPKKSRKLDSRMFKKFDRISNNIEKVKTDFEDNVHFERIKFLPTPFDPLIEGFRKYMENGQTTYGNIRRHILVLSKFFTAVNEMGVTDINMLDFRIIHDLYEKTQEKFWFSVVLKRFFKYCYQRNITEIDLGYIVPGYRHKKAVPSVYSQEELNKIISYVESSKLSLLEKIIFYLSYENALRTVDILNLKISDLDFERKELTLIQAKTKNKLKLGISDRLLNYIELYLKDERPECDAEYLLIGHGYNRKLKRLDRTTINKCVEAIIINSGVKIGIRHRGPHSLRASRATQLMNIGVPLPVISSYLGHTSTESTKNYLKADIDRLRECALDPIPILSPGLCALLGVMKNDF